MRVLFCKLLGFDRVSVIDARAYKINQHYAAGETATPAQVLMQADKEMRIFVKSNGTWIFASCQYSLGGTYLQGSIQVACPVPELSEEQYKILKDNFTLI